MPRRDTHRTHDTTPATPDRLVTVAETCERLTISRSTLWRMRRSLRPIRLTPTRVAYRERDITAWLDARQAGR